MMIIDQDSMDQLIFEDEYAIPELLILTCSLIRSRCSMTTVFVDVAVRSLMQVNWQPEH